MSDVANAQADDTGTVNDAILDNSVDGLPPDGSPQPGSKAGADDSSPGKSAPATTDKNTAFDIDDDDEGDISQKATDFPEDWRDKWANGDDKLLSRLKRFSTPDKVFKSFLESEKKLRSGAYKRALSEDATEEEVAAYRKENGIPETPDGYNFNELGDGYILTEADKPFVDSFRSFAHAKNMDPATAKESVKWFKEAEDAAVADRLELDKTERLATIEELRTEFGPEFRYNTQISKKVAETIFGSDAWSEIGEARLSNGIKIGNSPDIIRSLTDYALNNSDASKLMPSNTAEGAASQTELETINKVMTEDFDTYERSPTMRARRLELMQQLERRQGRG